jgi:Mrp family chromosome partitioning ATPase
LLVDADLKDPSLHQWADLPNENGFMNLVDCSLEVEKAVHPTSFPNVSVLTAGGTADVGCAALTSKSLRCAFERMADLFDVVVIDTPSTASSSVSQQVAHVADGTLLVVAVNRTRRPDLYFAIRNLRIVGANLVGAVINHPA